jgi:hypothetical protein
MSWKRKEKKRKEKKRKEKKRKENQNFNICESRAIPMMSPRQS